MSVATEERPPDQQHPWEQWPRERTLRRPIDLLHLDLRTTAAGIEFANGLTRPGWRVRHSEQLRIVVLGRHAGAGAAEGSGCPARAAWCAAVPDVITLAEEMPPADAAAFARTSWTAIAQGHGAAVVQIALAALPPAVHGCIAAPPADAL